MINKNSIKKIIKNILCTIIILVVLFFTFDMYVSISSNKKIYQDLNSLPNKDYGVLLGTSKYTKNGKINVFYKNRIDAAKDILINDKISRIIASGDNRNFRYNEPMKMQQDLVKSGISEDRVIIDPDGFRTLYSMLNIAKKYNIKEAIIVSQRFHLQRAIFIGKFLGLELIGYEAKNVSGMANIKIQVRERGARLKMIFDIVYFTVKVDK
ncbi:MAG: YdcF family protein [Spirochaetes bacterium]|nr:YdcF family protein [Spirochaetota bacterium]MBP8991283.1 YdcF family protein [Spirochaetota bacterium]HOV46016.1 ElyC/SanA/YdcF family protein [Exilispira sp.]